MRLQDELVRRKQEIKDRMLLERAHATLDQIKLQVGAFDSTFGVMRLNDLRLLILHALRDP